MPRKRHLFDLIVLLILAGITLCAAWIYRDFAPDDAYITYRYARNLSRGAGFVYNVGEPILGTSTPLYTMLLALLGLVSGQPVHVISHVVGAISLWAAGAALYDLGRDGNRWSAAAMALVFSSNAFLISTVGMETLFLLALILLGLRSYLDGKLILTGMLLGMLVLTRYECVLFAVLLGIHSLYWRKKVPFWLLVTMLVCLPWFIYAWSTFGHPIPRSALTKLATHAAGQDYPFAVGAIMWWHFYVTDSPGYWVYVPLVLAGLYAAARTKRDSTAYTLILAWTAVYFLGASIAAGSFPWYYAPLIPGFSILLVWGAEFLIHPFGALMRDRAGSNHTGNRLSAALLALIVLSIVLIQVSSWDIDGLFSGEQVVDNRFPKYFEAAQWLDRHADPNDSLAVEEIGILGYYTELTIIDLFGLVTPDVEPWLEQNRTETLVRAIAHHQPEYVLTFRMEWVDLLIQSDLYRPVGTFDAGHLVLLSRQ